MSEAMEVPFLGSIPLDPQLAFASDKGASIHEGDGKPGEAQAAIQRLISALLDQIGEAAPNTSW